MCINYTYIHTYIHSYIHAYAYTLLHIHINTYNLLIYSYTNYVRVSIIEFTK